MHIRLTTGNARPGCGQKLSALELQEAAEGRRREEHKRLVLETGRCVIAAKARGETKRLKTQGRTLQIEVQPAQARPLPLYALAWLKNPPHGGPQPRQSTEKSTPPPHGKGDGDDTHTARQSSLLPPFDPATAEPFSEDDEEASCDGIPVTENLRTSSLPTFGDILRSSSYRMCTAAGTGAEEDGQYACDESNPATPQAALPRIGSTEGNAAAAGAALQRTASHPFPLTEPHRLASYQEFTALSSYQECTALYQAHALYEECTALSQAGPSSSAAAANSSAPEPPQGARTEGGCLVKPRDLGEKCSSPSPAPAEAKPLLLGTATHHENLLRHHTTKYPELQLEAHFSLGSLAAPRRKRRRAAEIRALFRTARAAQRTELEAFLAETIHRPQPAATRRPHAGRAGLAVGPGACSIGTQTPSHPAAAREASNPQSSSRTTTRALHPGEPTRGKSLAKWLAVLHPRFLRRVPLLAGRSPAEKAAGAASAAPRGAPRQLKPMGRRVLELPTVPGAVPPVVAQPEAAAHATVARRDLQAALTRAAVAASLVVLAKVATGPLIRVVVPTVALPKPQPAKFELEDGIIRRVALHMSMRPTTSQRAAAPATAVAGTLALKSSALASPSSSTSVSIRQRLHLAAACQQTTLQHHPPGPCAAQSVAELALPPSSLDPLVADTFGSRDLCGGGLLNRREMHLLRRLLLPEDTKKKRKSKHLVPSLHRVPTDSL
ncbi:hypothetical protein DIPPA_01540 [Diplonema papillatum]|nr:hypothetical protein DIPPA_01540 [Diplonema papillatum]|eukprot:gene19511-30069_t